MLQIERFRPIAGVGLFVEFVGGLEGEAGEGGAFGGDHALGGHFGLALFAEDGHYVNEVVVGEVAADGVVKPWAYLGTSWP